jgi:hypothetical protein
MRKVIQTITAVVLLLLALSNAQAALINVGPNIWRDTATNLEWLSLTETTSAAMGLTNPFYDGQFPENQTTVGELLTAVSNSSYVQAQGFNIATTSQVAVLYTNSVGIYGGAGSFTADLWQLGETEAGLDYPVFDPSGAIVTAYQTGLQVADGGGTRGSHMVRDYAAPFGEPIDVFGGGTWTVADYAVTADQIISADDGCSNCGGYAERGVYLVRTAVPLPPAVWLFGSGLLALWRFKKHSV